MEQEIISPATVTRTSSQAFGKLGCFMASFGVTLLSLCLWGSAFVTTLWAFCRLVGLPDKVTEVVMLLGLIPAILITIWTAGRSWHVEKRLARHEDVDPPVFKLFYYFKKHL